MGNSAASLESRDGWERGVGVIESELVGGCHSQGLWEQVQVEVKVRKLRCDAHDLLGKAGGIC